MSKTLVLIQCEKEDQLQIFTKVRVIDSNPG